MSKPIDTIEIRCAANEAWNDSRGREHFVYLDGFHDGVRWAEQQLAAQAPEPTPATAGRVVVWTDVIPTEGDYLFGLNDAPAKASILHADQPRQPGKKNHSGCYCPLPLNLPAVVGEPVFRGQGAATEPDLSWVAGYLLLNGTLHLFESMDDLYTANTPVQSASWCNTPNSVVLHRTGKGE